MPRELPSGYGKDRIVAMVRDPFWIHCYWELTQQALARAALGESTAAGVQSLLDDFLTLHSRDLADLIGDDADPL